jgi:hypothetical protein
MYPAASLASGLIGENDLPDAVTVDGTSFSRSGTSYGNTTNGVILEENVWAKYRNAARSTRACLIQGGVEDQFADTYYASATNSVNPELSFSNSPMFRTGLCSWAGERASLLYQGYYPSELGAPFRDFWLLVGFVDGTAPPAPEFRLKTPVGGFVDRFNFSNISVSE